jgi:hypothetical protein
MYKKIVISFLAFLSLNAIAQNTLTITHGEIPKPTFLDHGEPGRSVGDIRIWNFDAKASSGDAVNTNWIMTTTGINQSKGIEQRIVNAAFYFNGSTDNQILIQGVAEYRITKAALEESVTTRRAIIGGTGKYANAQGWMETKHLPNGSWQHVLNLK